MMHRLQKYWGSLNSKSQYIWLKLAHFNNNLDLDCFFISQYPIGVSRNELTIIIQKNVLKGWCYEKYDKTYELNPWWQLYLRGIVKETKEKQKLINEIYFIEYYQALGFFLLEQVDSQELKKVKNAFILIERNYANFFKALDLGLARRKNIEYLYNSLITYYKKNQESTKLVTLSQRVIKHLENYHARSDKEIFDYIGILDMLAYEYQLQDKFKDSLNYYLRVLELFLNFTVGGIDNRYLLITYQNLSIVSKKISDFDKSDEYLKEATEISTTIDDFYFIAKLLVTQGNFYKESHQFEKALYHYQQAIKHFEDLNLLNNQALTYISIAQVYSHNQLWEESKYYYEKALAYYDELGDSLKIAQIKQGLGLEALDRGDYEEAIFLIKEALKTFITLNHRPFEADAYVNLANALIENKNYEDGLIYYQRALKVYEKLAVPKYIAETHQNLGELYRRINNYEKSEKHTNMALTYFIKASDYYGEAVIYSHMGNLLVLKEAFEEAEHYYDKSLRISKEYEFTYLNATVYLNMGVLYQKMNNLSLSQQSIDLSLDIFIEIKNIPKIANLIVIANNLAYHFNDKSGLAKMDKKINNFFTEAETKKIIELARKIYLE